MHYLWTHLSYFTYFYPVSEKKQIDERCSLESYLFPFDIMKQIVFHVSQQDLHTLRNFMLTSKRFKALIKTDYRLTIYKQDNFIRAIRNNSILTMQDFLKNKNDKSEFLIDPSAQGSFAIRIAAEYGYLKILQEFLKDKRVNPSVYNNQAIMLASQNGHLEIVKSLLKDKRVELSNNLNEAILKASFRGHLEIVKLLLTSKQVNPGSCNNHPIRIASRYGHVEVVKELLKYKKISFYAPDKRTLSGQIIKGVLKIFQKIFRVGIRGVNPAVNNNEALLQAYKNKHRAVVELLLEDRRVDPAVIYSRCSNATEAIII